MLVERVLRLTGAGDMSSQPGASSVFPLLKGPVSLVDGFCRDSRLVLAALRPLS
jgi:hypothetical protein